MNTPMTDVLELFIDKMSENEDLVKDVLELEPEELLLELKPKIRSALSKCMQLKIKADFNTFESTTTGNIHGMPLATITGNNGTKLTMFHNGTFYKNEKDEIVSDRIIINRVLKTNAKLPCTWNIIYLFIIILLSCFILFKLFIS